MTPLPFDPHTIAFDEQTLAGYEARLAAYHRDAARIRWRFRKDPPGEAAVLVPLCTVFGTPSILFTLRSASLRDHTSEVSFPGGGRDLVDASLLATALRETHEEIGVDPATVRVLGEHLAVPNKPTTKRVTPFVGFLGETGDPSAMAFNTDEVAQVFAVSMAHLLDPANREVENFRGLGVDISSWPVGDHRIWGLTAFILDQFLRTIVLPQHSPGAAQ
ncbi:NUDIX hydrolase domain-like protein [Entophlyctis helioformis]|nr:NUDIX hydrolase domain-like protein [Entophlyctis helioformis]